MRISSLTAMCLVALPACSDRAPSTDDDTMTDTDGLPDTGDTDTDTKDTDTDTEDTDTDTEDTDTEPDTDTWLEFAHGLPLIQITQSVGCALRASGELICWGNEPSDTGKWLADDELPEMAPGIWRLFAHNGLSVLGIDPSGTHVEPWPVEVGLLPPWEFLGSHRRPWVDLSMSGAGYAVCAVDVLGRIHCDQATPAPPSNPGWRTVEVGWHSVCAIHRTDGLACWGEPEEYGTLPQDHPDALSVSVGSRSTCVVTANRSVACAGASVVVDNVPSALSDVVDVEVAGAYACARQGNGELVCWGTGGPTEADLVVHDVPPGPFADVSLASRAACAIRPTGEILCWGTGSGGVTNPP